MRVPRLCPSLPKFARICPRLPSLCPLIMIMVLLLVLILVLPLFLFLVVRVYLLLLLLLKQTQTQTQTQTQNQNQNLSRGRAASRWSAPDPGQGTRREEHAPSHRPQMSSGRLFLDRVARQHCPSPLHRQPEHNTHSLSDRAKGDISTLPARGHFYFALTDVTGRCGSKVIMSPLSKVEMSP